MKIRQAFKITNATKITDLRYLNYTPLKYPLIAVGVREGYKYSWMQFKRAFRLVERYYSRKYGNESM